MSVANVFLRFAVVVATMLATATLVLIGPRRLAAALCEPRRRLEVCLLPLLVLGSILLIRWATVDHVVRLEQRVIGNNITPLLFELEQAVFPVNPVVALQSFQTPAVTSYFAFVYLYGYAFLLLFPLVAYFVLERTDYLSSLVLAFATNYAVGMVCYVAFVAFGPRNYDVLLFEGLLYDAFPRSQTLTTRVNQNTNVFPSLHTSLSMTVLGFAWHTRREYPIWLALAAVAALSVVVSTMYLGIHWFTDVVAGTVLAVVSVTVGINYTVEDFLESAGRYVDARLGSR